MKKPGSSCVAFCAAMIAFFSPAILRRNSFIGANPVLRRK